MKRLLTCILIASALSFSGCSTLSSVLSAATGSTSLFSSEQSDFDEAKYKDTIEAWETFLEKYPYGQYAPTANSRLANLYYERAAGTNTIAAWQLFVDTYPDHPYADQARSRMESLRLAEVRRTNTIEAYGTFAATAENQSTKQEADRLAYELAEKSGEESSYAEYLKYFPDGSFSNQARNTMQDIEEERRFLADKAAYETATAADTVAAYRDFLLANPGSQLAPDARSRLYAIQSESEQKALRASLVKNTWETELLDATMNYGDLYMGSERQTLLEFLYGLTNARSYQSMKKTYNRSTRLLQIDVKLDINQMSILLRLDPDGLTPRTITIGGTQDVGDAAVRDVFYLDTQLTIERYATMMRSYGIDPEVD